MTIRRSTGQTQRHIGKNLVSADLVGANCNALLNGCFRVAQRGTSFTAATGLPNDDGNYTLDRWLLVTNGDDVADVSQDTSTVPDGSYASMKVDVETANKKFAIAQIIEAKDTARLWDNQNGVVSLSFQAITEAGPEVGNLRAAVLAWTGAADTITTAGDNSDFLSAWNAAGSDPTWDASLTCENTPSNLALSTSWQRFEITNIALDTAGTTNLVVFIWTDDDDMAAEDVFWIADVQLEPGPYATPFQQRLITEELELCHRYYQQTYDHGTMPGTAANTNGVLMLGNVGYAWAPNQAHLTWQFKSRMRSVPTVTPYAPTTGNVNNCTDLTDSGDETATVIYVGDSSATFKVTGNPGVTGLIFHGTADAEL